jgi:hypothetical protein
MIIFKAFGDGTVKLFVLKMAYNTQILPIINNKFILTAL